MKTYTDKNYIEKMTIEEFNSHHRYKKYSASEVLIDSELAYYNNYTCLGGFDGTCNCFSHPRKSWICYNPTTGQCYTHEQMKTIEYRKRKTVEFDYSFLKNNLCKRYIQELDINPCNISYDDDICDILYNIDDYIIYCEYEKNGIVFKRYLTKEKDIEDVIMYYDSLTIVARGCSKSNYRELKVYSVLREINTELETIHQEDISKIEKKLLDIGVNKRISSKIAENAYKHYLKNFTSLKTVNTIPNRILVLYEDYKEKFFIDYSYGSDESRLLRYNKIKELFM